MAPAGGSVAGGASVSLLGVVPAEDARACRQRSPIVDEAFVEAVSEREADDLNDLFVDYKKQNVKLSARAKITISALRKNGVPSKALVFPDEGHWVLKAQNSKFWHETVFDWVAQYLK